MQEHFNDEWLVSSPDYPSVMNSEVLPWLETRISGSTVPGFDGKPLYAESGIPEHPAGTVLVLHGFTENTVKFSELLFSLLHIGYAVVSYDQRGHGRSWRDSGISDSSVTHVDRFEDYVGDLDAVCKQVLAGMPKPWYLFAHSMGGAVAVWYLEQYHDTFSAAVLCAPMIAPDLSGIPPFLISGLSCAAILLGRGKKHPFFMKPYSGPEDFASSCATDRQRFDWYEQIRADRKEFRNCVPTYQWVRESVRVTDHLLRPDAPENIRCPVMLFTAENDSKVRPEFQERLTERLPFGRQVLVHDARHEIYRSENSVLFPWWQQILSFLKQLSETPTGSEGEKQ